MADVFQDANTRYGECEVVSRFIDDSVWPRIERAVGPAPTADAQTVAAVFSRGMVWMRTLRKCKDPYEDFQAVSAAARTMLEIAVDLTLLQFDPSNPVAKLVAWEDSAKLKAAEKAKAFIGQPGRPQPPPGYSELLRFAATEGARIDALRSTYWPKPKTGKGQHPGRWTGRNLSEDVEAATALFRRGEFDAIYALRYAQLCWQTHGSALVGVRDVSWEDFPRISMLGFMECSHLSLAAAEVTLLKLGAWEPVVAAKFELFNRHRFRNLEMRLR